MWIVRWPHVRSHSYGPHFTGNALAVEAVKGNDHFLLVYPNTPAGRLAAKQAVRVWLLDCELDFDRRDAEQFWRAIDVRRFGGRLGRCGERGREAEHEKQETGHGRASGPHSESVVNHATGARAGR